MKLSEFHDIISKSDKPLVVDFWAPWCMPCKITKPVLEKLAVDYTNQVDFLPIDADASGELVKHYKIYAIPTVLAFHKGEVVTRVTGAQNKAAYQSIFKSIAEGKRIQAAISPMDRMLRIGAGIILGIAGLSTMKIWLILIGGLVGFWGIYDRCPIWSALTERFSKR